MKLHVLNGPNLNLLGKREPEIYGFSTLDDAKNRVEKVVDNLSREFDGGITLNFCQTNNEGDYVNWLNEIFLLDEPCAIILNPAAWTHYSVAISDALAAFKSRKNVVMVEVHISKVNEREDFRKVNFISNHVFETISGMGIDGYAIAADNALKELHQRGF